MKCPKCRGFISGERIHQPLHERDTRRYVTSCLLCGWDKYSDLPAVRRSGRGKIVKLPGQKYRRGLGWHGKGLYEAV